MHNSILCFVIVCWVRSVLSALCNFDDEDIATVGKCSYFPVFTKNNHIINRDGNVGCIDILLLKKLQKGSVRETMHLTSVKKYIHRYINKSAGCEKWVRLYLLFPTAALSASGMRV